ncbi:MAG: polysaccharide deacetylase family protein [Thermoflexaceae bacterium]|nr:polysaccharide deacetylase family protein [Thermoflexaceae bacterium]
MPAQRVKTALRRAGLTRRHAAAIRMCCERTALSVAGERRPARSRILCYHSVGTASWGVNDVAPARFRSQIETAIRAGYHFVPAELIASDEDSDERRLAITFDDGLASVATNAAPVLEEMGIPWTLAVVTDWADGLHEFGDGVMLDWRAIERLAEAGANIASHSVSHPDFGRIDEQKAEAELFESRFTIASRIGITPSAFAIPLGQTKNWNTAAQESAERAGYLTVYAQTEDRRHPGTVARTFVTRFDSPRIFRSALAGVFDHWEEWV